MDIEQRIIKNVEDGLVLDERGRWVSLTQKCIKEREFLSHLLSGEVLYKNRWVPLDKCSELDKKKIGQSFPSTSLTNRNDPNRLLRSIETGQPSNTPIPMDAPETEFLDVTYVTELPPFRATKNSKPKR